MVVFKVPHYTVRFEHTDKKAKTTWICDLPPALNWMLTQKPTNDKVNVNYLTMVILTETSAVLGL